MITILIRRQDSVQKRDRKGKASMITTERKEETISSVFVLNVKKFNRGRGVGECKFN